MKEISRSETNTVYAKNGESGLSLIEVMIALCIISVLMGIGTLRLNPLWKKHQLNTAVNEFVGKVQFFRMKAILEKSTCQLKMNGDTLFHRSRVDSSWSEWTEQSLAEEISYTMTGVLSFYDKGFASPKSIVLKGDNYSRKVIININGRARTSEIY